MNPDELTEFAEKVFEIAGPPQAFQPLATYDPDGDCIEFLAKPDPFYAKRVDDLVTVYYSQQTGEIVGSLIKSVTPFCKRLFNRLPGFRIEIEDGGILLQHIFLAKMWSDDQPPPELVVLTYRKLIEVASETVVEGELCVA